MVKSTRCSWRRLGFCSHSQAAHNKMTGLNLVPGNLVPSSGLYRHYIYTRRQNAHTYTKSIKALKNETLKEHLYLNDLCLYSIRLFFRCARTKAEQKHWCGNVPWQVGVTVCLPYTESTPGCMNCCCLSHCLREPWRVLWLLK